MPFKSEAQRRFMYARHPKIAKRWEKKTKRKKLPEKVSEGQEIKDQPPEIFDVTTERGYTYYAIGYPNGDYWAYKILDYLNPIIDAAWKRGEGMAAAKVKSFAKPKHGGDSRKLGPGEKPLPWPSSPTSAEQLPKPPKSEKPPERESEKQKEDQMTLPFKEPKETTDEAATTSGMAAPDAAFPPDRARKKKSKKPESFVMEIFGLRQMPEIEEIAEICDILTRKEAGRGRITMEIEDIASSIVTDEDIIESYNDNYNRPNQRERRTNIGMADETVPPGALEQDTGSPEAELEQEKSPGAELEQGRVEDIKALRALGYPLERAREMVRRSKLGETEPTLEVTRAHEQVQSEYSE